MEYFKDRIKEFLKEHPNFELGEIRYEPGKITRYATGSFVNTYPHVHGTDGFFAAKLIRRV
jgi:16S rRNA C967 or C1407 C5-methylase (RsmB/RsmF family)